MSNHQETVIVTGSSMGIGRAMAELARERGYRVVTAALEPPEPENSELHVAGDLTAPEVQQQVIDHALHGPGGDGRIFALLNNAGITLPYGPSLDITSERWDWLFRINVTVGFQMSQRVAPHMIEQGMGSIVNTASLAGLAGIAEATDYVATKHAVIGITKSLAIEWGPLGIRVNALAPGLTGTDTARDAVNATDPGRFERRGRGVPLGRIAEPLDQARAALFLISDDASYISGSVMVVDGATFAQHPGYAKH